jgi:hypothetical protein
VILKPKVSFLYSHLNLLIDDSKKQNNKDDSGMIGRKIIYPKDER